MSFYNENVWAGQYKIPWNDPDFSRRMLAEHLSQSHDMASRRFEWIDRQVQWIDSGLLGGNQSRVLDIGCGPGFYSHRLASLGHECKGLDFSPASIDYAVANTPYNAHAGGSCEFELADIRDADFGAGFNLAMILFGELNVFSPVEAEGILRKCVKSLAPSGKLIVELQSPHAVKESGLAAANVSNFESGLFSDGPYKCTTQNTWLEQQKVAIQQFEIESENPADSRTYRSTTRVWPDDEFAGLLKTSGFGNCRKLDDWPNNTANLQLWIAEL